MAPTFRATFQLRARAPLVSSGSNVRAEDIDLDGCSQFGFTLTTHSTSQALNIQYKQHSVEVKRRVLIAARDDEDYKTIAAHNGVDVGTARGWVRNAERNGTCEPSTNNRGGKRYKVTQEHVDFLERLFADNCQLSLKVMADSVEDRFRVSITPITEKRALDARSYVLKQSRREPQYMNTPQNKLSSSMSGSMTWRIRLLATDRMGSCAALTRVVPLRLYICLKRNIF